MTQTPPKKYRIYPSIGVARLGNGPADKHKVIFSPEIPWDNLYETDNNYLTEEGKIKKQAQRFYIYECDDQGRPVKQIDPAAFKSIEWKAEVANKKPFWYDFNNSLDLSIISKNKNVSPAVAENKIAPGIGAAQRNPNVLDMGVRVPGGYNYRKELVNHPAPVSVNGTPGQEKKQIMGYFPFPFSPTDNSRFVHHLESLAAESNDSGALEAALSGLNMKSALAESIHAHVQSVPLGTLEYDNGALIFYAADGKSASLNPSDLNTDFADNSNWYDDICDGRITATLTPNEGPAIELNDALSAAWVVTAPPDYAPQIQPISTMYDIITGASDENFPGDISLVFPLLYRLYRMQWVNLGDFLAPSFRESIDRLISLNEFKYLFDPSPAAAPTREKVFNMFRNPAYPYNNEPIIPSNTTTNITNRGNGLQELLLPYYPGDGINFPGSPAQWFAVPPLLYEQLEHWKDGNFKPDQMFATMDEAAKYYMEAYRRAAQDEAKRPLLMTRAVMETLYGGGFHPGVELTWPMRHNRIYAQNTEVYDEVLSGIDLFGLREVRLYAATAEEQREIFYNDFGFQMGSGDIAESMDDKMPRHWLWKITPGDLTKWMGIPWQSDAGSCQSVFIEKQYPTPAWWAANLPVNILPEESYYKLLDPNVLPETKVHMFANRLEWLRTTDTGFVGYHAEGGYMNGLIAMVYQWKKIGMVTGRKIDHPAPGIPEIVYVAFNGKDTDTIRKAVKVASGGRHEY